MKQLVQFADAPSVLAAYLRQQLSTTAVTVVTRLPHERSIDGRGYPLVLISQDGGGFPHPGDAMVTVDVRVTCWDVNEDAAMDLARLSRALLVTHRGDADVRSVRPLTSPFAATDPETDEPIASFSVTANLPAQVIPTTVNWMREARRT